LISHLSNEGYRIGSIKHVHHEGFTMDKEGTNTWRYAQAGSKVIAAISPDEIAIIKKTDAALNDLDQVIGLLEKEQLDIIIIEGFHSLIARREDIPKIITAKDLDDLQRTLKGTAKPILAITGVIAHKKPKLNELKIPLIDLPAEGAQLLKLIKKYLDKSNPPKQNPTSNSTA
jgi:molybdopterin-guanine dinucleotide biosynthesis adapter protein